MNLILKYTKEEKLRATVGLLAKVLATFAELSLPWIMSYIIDHVVILGRIEYVFYWGLIMLTCAVTMFFSNILGNRMAAYVTRNMTRDLRHDLFDKTLHLSCAQMDKLAIPSLVSRLTSDTYHIHQFVITMMRMGIKVPLLLLGGITMTFFLDPTLCLVMVVFLPPIAFLVYFISRKGVPLYADVQRHVDRMVRSVRENYTGIRVIRALSKTDYEKNKFAQLNQSLCDAEKKAGVTMALTNPLVSMLLNLGQVAVIVVGAFAVNAAISDAGSILAFLSYFTIMINSLLNATRIFVMYSKTSASCERINQIFEEESDMLVYEMEKIHSDEYIEFKDVSFTYYSDEQTAPILQDINFSVKKGETIGIIGAIGSGKSTIIQLLLRFYDAQSGQILIDGRDIKSIDIEVLRQRIGIVFQNDFLIADSIYDNINFGRDLEEDDIHEAIQLAQGAEFIYSLDQGTEHKLDAKGANFSGGQKQRILIARALASKPDILILDDSSSALDYATDAALRKGILEHLSHTTTVIVAQRISSIKHANVIIVLDKGKIVGKGRHEDLIKSSEIYQQILDSQMGGIS